MGLHDETLIEKFYTNNLKKKFNIVQLHKLFNENSFFAYFNSLTNDDKNDLISLIINKQKSNKDSEENQDFYNDIVAYLQKLLEKIDNNDIDKNEIEFAKYYYSKCMLNNLKIDYEIVEKLNQKFILNSPTYIPHELILLLAHTKKIIENDIEKNLIFNFLRF